MDDKYFAISADLGQIHDYTGITVLEIVSAERDSKTYSVRHIERLKGISYPDVVSKVKRLVLSQELKPYREDLALVIDGTGVGTAVRDLMKKEGLNPYNLIITGGHTINREGMTLHIPKKELVTNLLLIFQSGRLRIAKGIAHSDTLVGELENFKIKVNPKTAHESFEAWREYEHDDLVLSLSMACWVGENTIFDRSYLKPIAI